MSECVTREEMAAELASVRADMDKKLQELYTQLHYWQNITIHIYKEYFSSSTSSTCLI